jgi:GAF domain-containing protein
VRFAHSETRLWRHFLTATSEASGLREENRTLYRVINLVGSSIELGPMLQGIVDLATEATDCHACFIYLLGDGVLTIRAASPVYAAAVDVVQMRLDEGLTGWVARHRQAEFIRDNAMADPRMKFFPILDEERFQSMVAVPIVSRANDTIGVIVLHTVAPREFTEDTLKLLVHIASLVSGAIENAQLYDQQRRRVDALTSLSGLAQEVATAGDSGEIGRAVTRGMRRLLGAEVCQLYRIDRTGSGLQLLSSSPETTAEPEALSATALLLAAFDGSASPPARTLWPGLDVADLMVTPLISGGERLGLLCAGAPPRRPFTGEDTEMARAIAHLAAIAIKRAELIEGLTNANIVKDLFEALAAGATTFAVGKAMEVRCDLTKPYLMLCAEPAAGREQGSGEWRAAAEVLGRDLAELAPRSAVEAGPGPVRAVLSLGARAPQRIEEVVRACRDLGRRRGAAIGLSELHSSAGDSARAYRQALDATMIGRALLGDGGAIGYAEVGAYRYLVHIGAENAPHDRMRAAVDRLIDYDAKRRTSLLDTLERYLAERRSVIESARELFIHPNTLRQRLARIEDLTGLKLDEDDLLSLELAIKLARLHGRPVAARGI